MKKIDKVIEYYRVSTKSQGKSGLGLEAQVRSVQEFIKQQGATSICEPFIEIESGGNKDKITEGKDIVLGDLMKKRPKLLEAVKLATETGATILVKELSRLTRFSLLMNYIHATGTQFVCVDSPHDEVAILQIKCSLHEDELRKISARTKAALESIKKRIERDGSAVSKNGNTITKLGNPQNLTDAHRQKGRDSYSLKVRANTNTKQVTHFILTAKKEGKSLQTIARELNANDYTTARGGQFRTSTIDMYLRRHHAMQAQTF